MNFRMIRSDITNGVQIITLARPNFRNAFGIHTIREINAALDLVEITPSIRAVILTGSDGSFSAGADLSGMAAEDPQLSNQALEAVFNPLLERLASLPVPLVCAVNGVAAGGGVGYALAGDLVVAARSAYFLLPFAKLGLVPDVGTSWLLPRLTGLPRALGMALLGERVYAEQAEQWGMIWKAVDDNSLMETALDIAEKLASGPTEALSMTRKAFRQSQNLTLSESLALEAHYQRLAGLSPDCAEGTAAFFGKRQPVFQERRLGSSKGPEFP